MQNPGAVALQDEKQYPRLKHDDQSPIQTPDVSGCLQVEQSDLISFHNYSWPEEFEQRVVQLQRYHRPLICTEYMARGAGSIFDTILPIAQKHNVAMINWGLVAGKSQTFLPWDSWQRPYVIEQPAVWFHDVFHKDGTPYREQEVKLIKDLTRRSAAAAK